ncbi:CBS domain-containing protein [Alkalicoccobacillus gibsonii]|uniref:CBS domain-containing protein n=1 Tax=Alkalicoccobacillus gibsonii TaxID=79881 RepID=A0ABU9VLW5_9BACI
MKILASHLQIDFDGLASLIAAQALYPDATIVLPSQQQESVKHVLSLYRDTFRAEAIEKVNWDEVTDILIVDSSSLKRCGIPKEKLSALKTLTIYDHHHTDPDPTPTQFVQEPVGACVTLLIEKLREQDLTLKPSEALLLGLGLYSDTGSFQHAQTTERDLNAGAYLLSQGMDLDVMKPFLEDHLTDTQESLYQQLSESIETLDEDGLQIAICYSVCESFISGLAPITERLVSSLKADTVLSVVQMGANTYITGRSQTMRVNIKKIMTAFGGGGHPQAAAASVKKGALKDVLKQVKAELTSAIQPAITAGMIMSSPVHSIEENCTLDEAADALIRYGHTGMPVLNSTGQLSGVLSRRDLDKALRHGLGHSPIHSYMTKEVLTLGPVAPLETIQEMMITHNIGRIPILDHETVVGVVSRSDVLSILHDEAKRKQFESEAERLSTHTLKEALAQHFDPTIFHLLVLVGESANEYGYKSYLVGGGVRDVLLGRSNEDVDIVIEGNAIEFGEKLVATHGGCTKAHQSFGTTTWTTPSGIKVDLATARSEHYEQPALLPEVSPSSIREDLSRRDFTINAMAISLHPDTFGELLDHFQGQRDLKNGHIRILHSLSFIEDPTRIFRAVRFANRFTYQLHPETETLAKGAKSSLLGLSASRVMHELDLMQQEDQLRTSFQTLDQLDVWLTLLKSELTENKWMHIDQLMKHGLSEPFLFMAALCYEGDGHFGESIDFYALTSKDQRLLRTVREATIYEEMDNLTLGEWHQQLHHLPARDLLFIATKPDFAYGETIVTYIQKRVALPPLLAGKDLVTDLGLDPGPIFSSILTKVYSLQLDDKLPSKQEALAWAKDYYEKNADLV